MSESTGVGLENHPPQQKSNTKLNTYTGDKLNFLGTREINIDYQGQLYKLSVIIVTGKGPNSLDRNCLNVIKLDWT